MNEKCNTFNMKYSVSSAMDNKSSSEYVNYKNTSENVTFLDKLDPKFKCEIFKK